MRNRHLDIKPCRRCGIPRKTRHGRDPGLCADCRLIAIDLGELDKWTEKAA